MEFAGEFAWISFRVELLMKADEVFSTKFWETSKGHVEIIKPKNLRERGESSRRRHKLSKFSVENKIHKQNNSLNFKFLIYVFISLRNFLDQKKRKKLERKHVGESWKAEEEESGIK